tara:strand:+ start:58 stop:840 length:783 start_codon:yes stop_codon:yes gene_type:complete
MINLYLAAILPAVLILLFFFFRDRFREPPRVVFTTFVLGFLFVVPLGLFNILLDDFHYNLQASELAKTIYINLLRAAFHEEIYKFLILILYCSRHTKFNEPMDAVVYGVAVSLGFSARENIDYILNYDAYGITWELMASIRLLPTIMHAIASVIMGLFLSKALFSNQTITRRVFLAFLIPVLFHGLYNIFITYSTALALILLLVGFISVFVLYRRLRKIQSIKFHEAETKYEITARNIFSSIFGTGLVIGLIIITSIYYL